VMSIVAAGAAGIALSRPAVPDLARENHPLVEPRRAYGRIGR